MDFIEVREKNELLDVIEQLVDALIWTSGSRDFAPEGRASVGWSKVAQPAINAGRMILEHHGRALDSPSLDHPAPPADAPSLHTVTDDQPDGPLDSGGEQ